MDSKPSSRKYNLSIKKIARFSILAAIFFCFTLFLKIPFGIGGNYIDITDILIYITCFILLDKLVIIPATIALVLSDILNSAFIYSPITFISRIILCLLFIILSKKEKIILIILGILLTQLCELLLYFFWDMIIFGKSVGIYNLPFNAIQILIVSFATIFILLIFKKSFINIRKSLNQKIKCYN